MLSKDLIGLEVSAARKRLGYWYTLESQHVPGGVGGWYRFHRALGNYVELRTDNKNIVTHASGNGLMDEYMEFFKENGWGMEHNPETTELKLHYTLNDGNIYTINVDSQQTAIDFWGTVERLYKTLQQEGKKEIQQAVYVVFRAITDHEMKPFRIHKTV